MMSPQIRTQPCKLVLSTLLPSFLQVISAHAKPMHSVLESIVDPTPHAASIVIPIVTGFVQWIYNAYKQSYAFLALLYENAKQSISGHSCYNV